jgi:hypothetical protein
MRKILVIAICMVATPCVADEGIKLRPMPPFQPSRKACLSVYFDGPTAYWLNHCPYAVSVRWDDQAKCMNWSCQSEVAANARSTAEISGHVRWCECQGTLKTCDIPTAGC